MSKLFHTPNLDSLDWKAQRVDMPPQMKRYNATFEDLKIVCECNHTVIKGKVQQASNRSNVEFITYRLFEVFTKDNVRLISTGNNNQVEAALAYYSLYHKWPTI